MPGAIYDQELVFEQKGLGNEGTDAARLEQLGHGLEGQLADVFFLVAVLAEKLDVLKRQDGEKEKQFSDGESTESVRLPKSFEMRT